MAKTASIAVTDAAPVKLADGEGPQPQTFYLSVAAGGDDVTIGGADVVAGTGLTLTAAMAPVPFVLNGDQLFGICASGDSASVEVLQTISGLE